MKDVIKRLNSIIRNEKFGLFILSIIASIINYAFQIYLGHKLDVGEYGEFNYELAFITNCYALYAPLAVYACKITSENGRRLKPNHLIFKQIISVTIILSAVIMIAVPLYRFVSEDTSRENSFGYMVLLVFTIVGVSIATLILGVVQGLAHYWAYGFFNVILMASKLGIAFFTQNDVSGALQSILLSELLILLLVIIYLRRIKKRENDENYPLFDKLPYMDIAKLYGGIFLIQLLNSLYVNNGELMLMHHRFSDTDLGIYSVAALLSRIGVYITSIISTIILPEIAYNSKNSTKTLDTTLRNAFAAAFGISAVYLLALIFLRRYIIDFLYGPDYVRSGDLILYMIPFVIGVALIPVINSFYLGISKVRIIGGLYIAGVLMAAIGTFGLKLSIEILVIWYGVIMLLIDIFGYIAGINLCKKIRTSEEKGI